MDHEGQERFDRPAGGGVPRRVPAETNGLGLAGFVVSLVGLCSGGLLSPVGLILSLVALGKPPRGFAVAGTALGALGSCGVLLLLVMIPLAAAGALLAAGQERAAMALAALAGGEVETEFKLTVLATNIEAHADRHGGALPASLEDAVRGVEPTSGIFVDHWGNGFVYEVSEDGRSYRLLSKGPDGVAGTADDIVSRASRRRR